MLGKNPTILMRIIAMIFFLKEKVFPYMTNINLWMVTTTTIQIEEKIKKYKRGEMTKE